MISAFDVTDAEIPCIGLGFADEHVLGPGTPLLDFHLAEDHRQLHRSRRCHQLSSTIDSGFTVGGRLS
jgi:hypothetical protein